MANSIEWKLLQYYMNGFTSLGLERKISFYHFYRKGNIIYSHKVNKTGLVLGALIIHIDMKEKHYNQIYTNFV